MNIVSTIKDSFILGETPAARQEVELREKDKILKKIIEKDSEHRKKILRCLS